MIIPDDKDWTWVLTRPCPECGFDARDLAPADVADRIRANAAEWRRLHAAGVIHPGRPDAATWSALEYACHVRDVFGRFDRRIALMQEADDPEFPNWDQDASAVADRYETQDPDLVLDELEAAAETVATRLDGVRDDTWERPGRRSDGATFTVASIAVYMLHDPEHHVWDVTCPR